ncbi:MAG: hypothetical protein ACM3X9_05425 [Bacillota bacterium]
MNIDKLDLIHKLFLVVGPKIDRKLVKNLLAIATVLSDRDMGDELKQIVKKF